MPIQRSRFHSAIKHPPPQAIRTEIVEPVAGLNRQRPASNLRPGETPFSQNWVMGDRYIEPRSGISQWGTTSHTSIPLGFLGSQRFDKVDTAVLLSGKSISQRSDVNNWTAVASTAPLSGTTSGYYSMVAVFDPATTAIAPHVILCNKDMPPKVLGVAGNSSLATLEGFYSIDSYARYVTAFDDRVIFFHSGTTLAQATAGVHPTRISYTGRGSLNSFAIGGFEDLNDMQGVGTGLVPERDRLILLSDKEVWAGRPRRDAYAFDFFNLDKSKGCPADYDRTPKNTEAGTIWLGEGFQFYRAIGNEVRALGDKVRDVLKDEMREWAHSWSLYNPKDHIYAFLYSDTTGEYPTKALFLRTDTVQPTGASRDDGVWFLQDFGSFQFPVGGVFKGDTVLMSSAATPYRLLSTQTNDAGTAIDCRWRSHSLRAERDLFPYEALQEFWLEYEYDSATTSTLNLYQSTDNAATFGLISNASLTSGTGYPFIPVTGAAARNQAFEIRLNDGTKPRIARMQLKLRGYTGRFAG